MSIEAEDPEREDELEAGNEIIIKLLRVIVAQNNAAFGLEMNEDDIAED